MELFIKFRKCRIFLLSAFAGLTLRKWDSIIDKLEAGINIQEKDGVFLPPGLLEQLRCYQISVVRNNNLARSSTDWDARIFSGTKFFFFLLLSSMYLTLVSRSKLEA